MITEKTATVVNNSGLGVNRFNLVMTPEVFKVFYSSLYEDKELAVLRELVANGDDGYVAAGKKGEAVIIHLPTKLVPELTIVDYGSGMSLEDIQTIYTTYGKSSKRDSNDEIGGFGYGAKSPFAISQSFTVETTKNGITTSFVNFIDEDGPNYTVISSEPTDLPSGTTVKIPVPDHTMQHNLALKAGGGLFILWETPPIIKNSQYPTPVPMYSVNKRHDTYLELHVNNYGSNTISNVGCGPFMYRIPVNLLTRCQNNASYQYLQTLVDTTRGIQSNGEVITILPIFGVGELELSPSRERIEDTKENEVKILARCRDIETRLRLESMTLEQDVTRAFEIIQDHGILLSQILGSCDADHIVTFKDYDAVIRDIIPADREISPINIAASILAAHQTETLNPNYTEENVPDWILKHLVSGRSEATTRVMAPRYQGFQSVHTLKLILHAVTGQRMAVQRKVSALVISQFTILSRPGRNYHRSRDLEDKQTMVVVPPRAKIKVSRVMNCVSHGWGQTSIVFSEQTASVTAGIKAAAKFLGFTFNFVDIDEINRLMKTIPKTKRNATSSAALVPAGPVTDRKMGRVYFPHLSGWAEMYESHLAALTLKQNVLLFVVTDIRRIEDVLSTDVRRLIKELDVSIMCATHNDMNNKKFIKDALTKVLGNNTTHIYNCDTYQIETRVTDYLYSLPNGSTLMEEMTAGNVIDRRSFDKLYPNATVLPLSTYLGDRTRYQYHLLALDGITNQLKSKWLGYCQLNDIKELDQLMTKADMKEIKRSLVSFTKSKYVKT